MNPSGAVAEERAAMEALPDDVLRKVLSFCRSPEWNKARRVSKRFQHLISSQQAFRPTPDQMRICVGNKISEPYPRGLRFGKRHELPAKEAHIYLHRKQKAKVKVIENAEQEMSKIFEQQLTEVRLAPRLSFEGPYFVIDAALLQTLQTKPADLRRVDSLVLEMTRVACSEKELAAFVAGSSISELVLDFCHLPPHVIGDEVFAKLPQLKTFVLQSRGHQSLPHLTDATLNLWSTSDCIEKVDIRESFASFSMDGIYRLLQRTSHARFFDLGTVAIDTSSSDRFTRMLFDTDFSVTIAEGPGTRCFQFYSNGHNTRHRVFFSIQRG